MNEEMIEVLDKNGNGTGIIKCKSEIKEKGLPHKGASIIIFNNNNEILIHRRNNNKKVYPGLWSSFIRGHVKAYESSLDAIIRETKEELGIELRKEDIKFLYSLNTIDKINDNYINNIFFDNYITTMNVDINDIKLQDDEVSEVKFISPIDLKNMIINKDKDLVPNYEDYKKIINILDNNK